MLNKTQEFMNLLNYFISPIIHSSKYCVLVKRKENTISYQYHLKTIVIVQITIQNNLINRYIAEML